jgi:hypothetical protein
MEAARDHDLRSSLRAAGSRMPPQAQAASAWPCQVPRWQAAHSARAQPRDRRGVAQRRRARSITRREPESEVPGPTGRAPSGFRPEIARPGPDGKAHNAKLSAGAIQVLRCGSQASKTRKPEVTGRVLPVANDGPIQCTRAEQRFRPGMIQVDARWVYFQGELQGQRRNISPRPQSHYSSLLRRRS